MPRAISKTDIIFGLIRVGVEDEVFAWIDRSAKQLVVGDREFEFNQLSPEQAIRLDVMARAVLSIGELNDAGRGDLEGLVDELIRQHTH